MKNKLLSVKEYLVNYYDDLPNWLPDERVFYHSAYTKWVYKFL